MVNLSRLPIPCVGKIVNVQDSLCEKLFLFPPFVSISFENNEQMKRGYFFSIQQNIMLMTNREITLRMSVPEGTLIRSMMKSHFATPRSPLFTPSYTTMLLLDIVYF